MIDQEAGSAPSRAPSRSPAQLGRIGSADLARRATAANLRDVGVNVNPSSGRSNVGRRGTFQARTGRLSNPSRASAMAVAFV